VNALANPLGCYDERRFEGRGGRDRMIEEVMSVFHPAPFSPAGFEVLSTAALSSAPATLPTIHGGF
jgi:hypothetical protein